MVYSQKARGCLNEHIRTYLWINNNSNTLCVILVEKATQETKTKPSKCLENLFVSASEWLKTAKKLLDVFIVQA